MSLTLCVRVTADALFFYGIPIFVYDRQRELREASQRSQVEGKLDQHLGLTFGQINVTYPTHHVSDNGQICGLQVGLE